MDALRLYEKAVAKRPDLQGYYHHNSLVADTSGVFLVRIPDTTAERMDLSLWREAEVLRAVQGKVRNVPRLLHESRNPDFQVHEFVKGQILDDFPGRVVMHHVIGDVRRLFADMLMISIEELPDLPGDWPQYADSTGFALRVLDVVDRIRDGFGEDSRGLCQDLGVPEEPSTLLRERAGDLARRRFCLLHGDIHRRNIVVRDGRSIFLDWEFALWGDPVYDLADHLHKMAYSPAEARTVASEWEELGHRDYRYDWRAGLTFYLACEQVKSAVVDVVRWGRLIRAARSEATRRQFAEELAWKIRTARPHWGLDAEKAPSPEEVAAAALHWDGTVR